jgi:hypothetical protein
LLSLDWVGSKWVLLGCGLVTVRLCDAIEASSLMRQVHYLFTSLVKAHVLPLLSQSNQGLAFLAIGLHVILSHILACITI